jgi:DNA-binding MurR/RpiR family transcriptional regulator
MEQIHMIGQGDLLIAFSFPPYSRETIEFVKAVAEKKRAVVAITDRVTSPISFYASRILPIASQNMLFTNSFSAMTVLINALTTEVALRNRVKATKNLKESERLLQENGYYYAG